MAHRITRIIKENKLFDDKNTDSIMSICSAIHVGHSFGVPERILDER